MNCIYSTGKQMKFQGEERFYLVTFAIAHVTPNRASMLAEYSKLVSFQGENSQWPIPRTVLGRTRRQLAEIENNSRCVKTESVERPILVDHDIELVWRGIPAKVYGLP